MPRELASLPLLHILGTLDRPDSGRLEYTGKNVLEWDDTKLARFRNQTIGFVFQFHHLLPEFSALENTMMPALIDGVGKKTAKQAAERILIRVGLKERLNHRAGGTVRWRTTAGCLGAGAGSAAGAFAGR